MRKVILTGIVVVGFVFYAIFADKSTPAVPVSNNKNTSSDSGSVAATLQSSGAYKDGTFTGSAVDAFYGTVQVQAVIQGGKITDVQFLQYPNDQRESLEVSTSAMPLLKQEAIQKQNAQVDMISGATQTSNAFKESLAAALAQAK